MDLNKFTEQSQAALMKAQNMAARNQQQAVDVEHLLLALLEQEGGLVPRLFEKAQSFQEPRPGRADCRGEVWRLHRHAAEKRLREGGDAMKTMVRKLNIQWEADVEFAVPMVQAGSLPTFAAWESADRIAGARRRQGPRGRASGRERANRGLRILSVLRSALAAMKRLACQPSKRIHV